jgi:hypothetical protein
MSDPTAMILATKAAQRQAESARPNAPVRPDRPRRRWQPDGMRRRAATILHRLADRVEPPRVETCRASA